MMRSLVTLHYPRMDVTPILRLCRILDRDQKFQDSVMNARRLLHRALYKWVGRPPATAELPSYSERFSKHVLSMPKG